MNTTLKKIFNSIIKKVGSSVSLLVNGWSEKSYLPTTSLATTTWIDGTPLITTIDVNGNLIPDSRTQDIIGSKIYVVAMGDESLIYFIRKFTQDIIDVREIGILPNRPDLDCGPLFEALWNYFPVNNPQTFYFAPGEYYIPNGVALHNRSHTFQSTSTSSRATFRVNPSKRGMFFDGLGTPTGKYFNIFASGYGTIDGPRDDNGNLDYTKDDPYAYNNIGIEFKSVVKFYDIAVGGFGVGIKGQAYITNGGENASLYLFDGLSVTTCKSDAVLVIGADCNAGLITNFDIRDNGGWGYRDESLLGNHLRHGHFNNNGRGTFIITQAGNSSKLSEIYSEEQNIFTPSPFAPLGYGGYLYGTSSLDGGTVRVQGSGTPGSPVYCSPTASAKVGSYSSGLKFGGVSLTPDLLYFFSAENATLEGLAIRRLPVTNGYSIGIGRNTTSSVGQIFTLNNRIIQTNRKSNFDSSNWNNPYINGFVNYKVKNIAELKALSIYHIIGDKITLGDNQFTIVSAGKSTGYECIAGGQFKSSYTSNVVLTFLQSVGGNQEYTQWQASGSDPQPLEGDYINLIRGSDTYGPVRVLDVDLVAHTFYTESINIPNINNSTYTITYAKPDFIPTSTFGRGLASNRPTSMNEFDTGYRYYATDTKISSTWDGTIWF